MRGPWTGRAINTSIGKHLKRTTNYYFFCTFLFLTDRFIIRMLTGLLLRQMEVLTNVSVVFNCVSNRIKYVLTDL